MAKTQLIKKIGDTQTSASWYYICSIRGNRHIAPLDKPENHDNLKLNRTARKIYRSSNLPKHTVSTSLGHNTIGQSLHTEEQIYENLFLDFKIEQVRTFPPQR